MTSIAPPFYTTVPLPTPKYTSSHSATSLSGPGDSRPTALSIIRDNDLLAPALSHQVHLITGCSSGIGVETARALHATGAEVWITVRDAKQGEAVAKDIKSDGGDGKIEVLKIELDSFESVRAGAKEFIERQEATKGKGKASLNVLICNAGVMACPYSETRDGHERQFGTNHLGHFLLFQLLKPLLLSSATSASPSRVITVSSSGHHNLGINFTDLSLRTLPDGGYNPWLAYGQSKTANIYMANYIERHYGASSHLHANSLMPGGIETPLQKYQPHLIPNAKNNPESLRGMKSTEQGAATTVLAAVGKEWEGVGGVYLEDCEAAKWGEKGTHKGYASHAFDEEAEDRLWKVSCGLVGVEED